MSAQTRIPRLLLQQQQPRQFGSGLGNSGGGQPPHDERQQDPPRGHYQERPTDFLRAMQDAGIYRKHTLCLHCGKPATRVHRQNWRLCKDVCPFDPSHLHDGALCPRLLRVANEEWCLSHPGSFMLAEREASRNPENAQRAQERRAAKDRARDDRRATIPPSENLDTRKSGYGKSFDRARESGFDVGYENSSYGAGYDARMPMSGYESGRQPHGGYDLLPGGKAGCNPFTDPGRTSDIRERSPQRESTHTRGIEYRDRVPSHVISPSPAPLLQRGRSTERLRPSQEPEASRLAALQRDRAAWQHPPVVPTRALQASPSQTIPPPAQPDSSQAFEQLLTMYQQSQAALEQLRATLQQQTQRLSRSNKRWLNCSDNSRSMATRKCSSHNLALKSKTLRRLSQSKPEHLSEAARVGGLLGLVHHPRALSERQTEELKVEVQKKRRA